MANHKTLEPQIAISPKGDDFMVTPALVGDEVMLRVHWDGVKLDFADADDTPLDEGAVEAVGHFVNGKLALEWGESVAQVQMHRTHFLEKRTSLYLKHRQASEVFR
jgi:hypothetical protein